jgi:hypothetical protein
LDHVASGEGKIGHETCRHHRIYTSRFSGKILDHRLHEPQGNREGANHSNLAKTFNYRHCDRMTMEDLGQGNVVL